MRDPDETLAALDDVLSDWHGSPDAMTWTADPSPPPPPRTLKGTLARWAWTAVKVIFFLHVWIVSAHLTVKLTAGIWGTPVATVVGLVGGLVVATLGMTAVETIRERRRRERPSRREGDASRRSDRPSS
ncbi:hypothetical protein [Streptosporangium carneum]|uniref:Uncharacterized protein n=1 Tax=Streptosporangium carneum TaxID=47481 RepID=A0A9W6I7X4_9ACTN|nr:hypothetical protein [Streptosporangium carneum]GLK13740.1 hypothetical protein GCM10017600_71510 [Streptosporangium carneum]